MNESILFSSLHLNTSILRAVQEEGYKSPTPIQAKTIPVVLKGGDLLGIAQTGTGKTAAFVLPILNKLMELATQGPVPAGSVLVLAPTRELAIQIGESIGRYGKYSNIKHTVIFGGVSQSAQERDLKRNPQIIVATPGRLLDLMAQRHVSLKNVTTLVLDEADRMLDMGFLPDVKRILREVPRDRQTMLFSATMPTEIAQLSGSILRSPEKIAISPISSTAPLIEQFVYFVSQKDKRELLLELVKEHNIKRAIVFTRTKHVANRVTEFLQKAGVPAAAIHSNKSQNARQRALSDFKDGKVHVLVASDIASRGIDVDDITHVVNLDLPNIPETYVHRIGRTGRAQAKGTALSFCSPDELAYLRGIEKTTGKKLVVVGTRFEATASQPSPAPAKPAFDSRRPRRMNGPRRAHG